MGLYYLQSRYYDPEVGRFINGDALLSTVDTPLSGNSFAYCVNNPIIYIDPNGCRFIGFGFQFELQVGDISYGVEIVIYTDSQICKEEDFLVAIYKYSGYDISIGELQTVTDLIETIITTFAYETHNFNVESFYSAATLIFNGAGVSGGAYLLYGNDDFDEPEDYSGEFETWSGSGKIKGATVTAFHSYSDICDAYGIKVGAKFSGLRVKKNYPFGVAYSRSYYSEPWIMEL